MILKPNKFAIVPCIIISVILHGAVFFVISLKNKKETFIQVPFEVSFYAPYAENIKKPTTTDTVQNKTKSQKTKEVETKPLSPKTTSEIVTQKKPEEKKKKTEEKNIEKPSEVPVAEVKENKEQVEAAKPVAATDETETKETAKEKNLSGNPEGFEYTKGIMLENKNFRYSYYTSAILKKIRRYWQDSNINVLRTVVYFRIEKDGTVSKLKISKSSKNDVFDKNALRAIELASPFPPLPDGYTENNLGVYFEFKTT